MTIEAAEIGFWIALTLWVVGFILGVVSLVFRKEKLMLVAVILAAAGLVPHTIGIGVRWAATGRPPFINLYELVGASAWFAVVTYLVVQAIWKSARPTVVGVLPVAFLSMGLTLTLSPAFNPLSSALKSWWLLIHILFALIAHGCFAVSFGASIFIVKRPSDGSAIGAILAPEKKLDLLSARCIIFGFICHTIMVLSGAIWAHKAWGRYWGWDPVETWSLVTWLMYGLYVHLRFLPKWKGKWAAIFAIIAFLLVIFSFWGIPHLWDSVHDYTLYGETR